MAAAIVILLLGTAFFLFTTVRGSYPALDYYPLDDSYIHLVYTRSISETGLPCYNKGEMESGMTSPLWVILQTPLYFVFSRFFDNPTIAGKLLGCLLASFLAWGIFRLTSRDWGFAPAGCAAIITLLDPLLLLSRLSGMEILLAATLIVFTVEAWMSKRWAVMGWMAGLAILARPEAVLLAAIACGALAYEVARKRERPRALVAALTPALVLPALWVSYNLAATGMPLPNTFYAKSSLGQPVARQVLHIVSDGIIPAWSPGIIMGPPLLVFGCIVWLKKNPRAWLLVFFPWIFILSLAASRTIFDYNDLCNSRYFIPVIPLMLAAAFAAVFKMFELIKKNEKTRWLIAFIIFLVVATPLASLPKKLIKTSKEFAWNCMNTADIHVRLGKWIDENTPASAAVAAKDAGAVRFFGNRFTIDLLGLNTSGMLDHRDPLKLVREVKPDFFVLPSWHLMSDPRQQSMERTMSIGKNRHVRLVPVFTAKAENYTITEFFPGVQIIYMAKYPE